MRSINSLRELRAKKAQKKRAIAITIPSPMGGLNTRDGLASMPPECAVILKNWWPTGLDVRVRGGYLPWSGSLSGYVETLMSYSGPTANKLFAATSSGNIYNITGADEFLTDELGNYLTAENGYQLVVDSINSVLSTSGITNGRIQYVNFTTTGGNYIRTVNGADYSMVYDGTSWNSDGDGAPYDITGVDSRTLIHINMHKNRLWFVQEDTLDAWYLATLALGGAATKFSLNSIAQKGGYLVAMATWTIDAGYGVDDLAVFVTSNGEVIVYRGTDPASSSTWALVGVWAIGQPIGRRCLFKWAGDLLIISEDGVQPMSAALQSSRINPRVNLTDIIQPTISQAVSDAGDNFGWQLIYNANINQLMLNVPVQERINQQQYAMNTVTKAWAQFTGWQSNCWEMFDGVAYFGGNGFVGMAWESNSDAGIDIDVAAIQAFNYLGKPGIQKRMNLFQPLFYTNGSPSIFGGVNVDFDTTISTTQVQVQPSVYAMWDSAVWDSSKWAPDIDLRKSWNGAIGVGNAFAPALNSSINGIELQWVNSTLVWEEGGIL